ncbi:MAG: hypothetical protein K6E19_09215 [Lachnospiraceae bacterium]|nr:hypothetical protein [Lachnospiraceae bacterium]
MVLTLLLIGCGFYLLYSVIRMKVTGEIPRGLINVKINLDRAHDKEGYIKYIFPRGIIFGIILIASSTVLLLSEFMTVSPYLMLAAELLYFGGIIYYAVISVKAQNKFLF